MNFKKTFTQLNIFAQCKGHGLSLWQCPQFLFLIMGIIIIASILATYIIGAKYIEEPELVALITFLITAILFILAVIITHSFERLAEASRMKSEFVRIVSHQLRSPITNMKWTIDILLLEEFGKITEKQLEYFTILKENSFRMEDLVKDLLTVSRIEEGSLPLRKEKMSFEKIINESILRLQSFAAALNVKIEFSPAPGLPEIFIDPNQIKTVIENFLDNAIRYTKEGGKVEIKLEQKKSDLYFEIKDNGIGIPKEDQKYIFQKFFRSKNTLRYQVQGSGLGLYISRAIVEKSGGKIGFKSEENKGSTFWFTLPC